MAPSIRSSPYARLMTFISPNTIARPSATSIRISTALAPSRISVAACMPELLKDQVGVQPRWLGAHAGDRLLRDGAAAIHEARPGGKADREVAVLLEPQQRHRPHRRQPR